MKFLNKKQKNNKGFSLVELIVVIAIMVVLVAVLAPVFTRYIESSRRATDVQNANSIAEAVLADFADQKAVPTTRTKVEGKNDLKAKGSKKEGQSFEFLYDPATNTCAVYVGDDTLNLANDTDAQAYKDRTGE